MKPARRHPADMYRTASEAAKGRGAARPDTAAAEARATWRESGAKGGKEEGPIIDAEVVDEESNSLERKGDVDSAAFECAFGNARHKL